MRPKKSILLYCANETYASQMRFKLSVWAYEVVDAANEDALLEAYAKETFDLVLMVPATRADSVLIDRMQKLQNASGQSLRIADKFGALRVGDASYSVRIGIEGRQMREDIEFAVSRKRGPRPVRVSGEQLGQEVRA